MSLKVIFAGTPDFAARHLQALIDSDHQVIAAYTQPDRPAGRGKKLQASAVKQLAQAHDIEVLQPESLKDSTAQAQLAALGADIMIVVAYGLILPKAVLETPKLGCINVHGSILPRWRGAAPIQRAIWAGDNETGVTIMQMDIGLDTGDMLHIVKTPITEQDTSTSLYEKLAESGPAALIEALAKIAAGDITAQPQNNALANYAKKLSKQEALIDWQKNADFIARCVRAFNPWPVSYFVVDGKNIKVWQSKVIAQDSNLEPGTVVSADKNGIAVQTRQGQLLIEKLQLPGKKPVSASDAINARQAWFSPNNSLVDA